MSISLGNPPTELLDGPVHVCDYPGLGPGTQGRYPQVDKVKTSKANTVGGESGLVSLAQRQDFPKRVRAILQGSFDCASNELGRIIKSAVDEMHRELFKFGERASTATEQNRHFEAIAEFKRAGDTIAPRFLRHLESDLAHFDRNPAPTTKSASKPGLRNTLELVDSNLYEEELALRQMGSRITLRNGPILQALSYRLGVLGALPAFDVEAVPLGPARIAAALQYAMQPLELARAYRLLAFTLFERMGMAPIGELYRVLNTDLIERGVLPNLMLSVALSKSPNRTASDAGADSDKREAGEKDDSGEEEAPAADAAPAANRRAGDTQHFSPAAQHEGAPTAPFVERRQAGRSDRRASAESDGPEDAVLYATLRTLLANRYRAAQYTPPNPQHAANQDDLQRVLAAMQRRPIDSMVDRQGLPGYDSLSRQILDELSKVHPYGRSVQMQPEDADTVRLVTLLFDNLATHVQPDGAGPLLLNQLLTPMLRVALTDKRFFSAHDNPARRLVNTVTDIGSRWLDNDADPELVQQLVTLVGRLGVEFDGEVGQLETLQAELDALEGSLSKRAQVTERRLVDAAKGRERLDLARRRSHKTIARLIANRPPPTTLLRNLLTQAWTDLLTLTILRQGEDSLAFRRRVAVADQLLKPEGLSPATSKALRSEIEEGLVQVGLHKDDVRTAVNKLFEAPALDSSPDAANDAEFAEKLVATTRLGGDMPPVDDTPEVKPKLAPAVEMMVEEIRSLPFGTWFHYQPAGSATTLRRKLAWYSPVTGNCLMVNQRGVRTEDKTMVQLAIDIVEGTMTIVEDTETSFVDRAWNAIVKALRSFGSAAAEVPA